MAQSRLLCASLGCCFPAVRLGKMSELRCVVVLYFPPSSQCECWLSLVILWSWRGVLWSALQTGFWPLHLTFRPHLWFISLIAKSKSRNVACKYSTNKCSLRNAFLTSFGFVHVMTGTRYQKWKYVWIFSACFSTTHSFPLSVLVQLKNQPSFLALNHRTKNTLRGACLQFLQRRTSVSFSKQPKCNICKFLKKKCLSGFHG